MTRRELAGSAQDVGRQSRDLDVSDGFSERSSTLPTYEDAVGDTPSLTREESKSSDGKNHGKDHTSPSCSNPNPDMYRPREEQLNATSTSVDIIDKPKERKVTLRRKLFWVLGVVVLYNVLARLLFANIGWGKHTPTPSEPESDDSSWPSPREIRVHEVTNAIHGTYPLYDLLDLSTLTGAIDVTIEPKSGNRTAVVKINSKTGAIHVRFAKCALSNGEKESKNEKGVFERVYNTRIHTMTGKIHANLLHGGTGGEMVISTQTGMLDLRITPIGDHASKVETRAMTGLSKITVEAPMQATTLKNLTAVHRSTSTGTLDVTYPREWEGRVHAWCSGTGSVDVRGEGLNLQGGGKNIYAWRGEDASKNGKVIEVVSEHTGSVRFKA